jgi:uncharacterized protein YyaL (SSP411 family)
MEGRTNRLAREKSPYLLQHARNPVDWYPWGEEAFETARRLDRPIFLSIGYATCHWCHVMERESFEDAEVAALMNESLVSVKIDREERPDLDHFFMTLCQGLTGSGGWPLTIVMTPDRKPFFAGTYFPRSSRFGRIGMLELVPRLDGIWKEKRQEVVRSAEEILSSLQGSLAVPETLADAPKAGAVLDSAREQISSHHDSRHGGFGQAPKFPHPDYLRFLLRAWKRAGDEEALAMAEKALTAMRLGGIYDHVGFGFHRYSTDEQWLLPHFEKMLYDQALLSMVYVEAWQATGEPLHRRTAEEVFTYVLRDLRGREGGFFSAEDADSEGVEGKFYLWTLEEVETVLGREEAAVVREAFCLKKEGNFVDELGAASERNIFHRTAPPGALTEELEDRLEEARSALFAAREGRVRPLRDDKVLTDWNGLMIASLAKGGAAFEDETLTKAAEEAAAFLLSSMRSPEGRLLHRYREGEAAIEGHLDDYAFLAWGLIELYQATFKEEYLSEALRLTDEMLSLFWDGEAGGLFFTSGDADDLPLRQKVLEDGSVPSGNSVAAFNLLRLARITGAHRYEEHGAAIFQASGRHLEEHPSASCHLLGALESAEGPSYEVAVVGLPRGEDTEKMLRALRRSFQPNLVTLFLPANEDSPAICRHAPHLKGLRAEGGRARAYVCSAFQCGPPATTVQELMEQIGSRRNGKPSGDR